MKRYVRVFQEHEDYSNFTGTQDFMLPNVSCCVTENEVHYNPTETTNPDATSGGDGGGGGGGVR